MLLTTCAIVAFALVAAVFAVRIHARPTGAPRLSRAAGLAGGVAIVTFATHAPGIVVAFFVALAVLFTVLTNYGYQRARHLHRA